MKRLDLIRWLEQHRCNSGTDRLLILLNSTLKKQTWCVPYYLLSVFDKNVEALKAATGMIGLGPIDPIAAIIAGQNQMKALASEIQRSTNVGIGYAFSVEHLLADAAMG